MVAGLDGTFRTQCKHPRLALVQPWPDGDLLSLSAAWPGRTWCSTATVGLRQLLDPSAYRVALIHYGWFFLPCSRVEDRPRFAWRGCHLDVARHFPPKREVLRFVELPTVHKLNVLHLTDDQGWRVEMQRFPELTRTGAWRRRSMVGRGEEPEFDSRPHGGFYTTEDLREIVAHTARHHITVVPEVDVPGHSQAAIAAYPELSTGARPQIWDSCGVSAETLNTDPATVDFYRVVLDHLIEVPPPPPPPVICIGGEEVPGTTPEHGVFLRSLVDHIHSPGVGRRASGVGRRAGTRSWTQWTRCRRRPSSRPGATSRPRRAPRTAGTTWCCVPSTGATSTTGRPTTPTSRSPSAS